MTMHSCRDCANFNEQMSTKSAILYAKGDEPHAYMVMCARYPLQKNEA